MARKKVGNGIGLMLTVKFSSIEETEDFYNMITTSPVALAEQYTLDEPTQSFIDNLELETALLVQSIKRSSKFVVKLELRGICYDLNLFPKLLQNISGVKEASYREIKTSY